MTYVNNYTRVRLDALLGTLDATWGQWTSVNIDAALATSRGLPLDWWIRGSTAGNISNGFFKNNSPGYLTVTVLNATDGQPADAGHGGVPPGWASGTITWTNGPAGPPGSPTGSTTQAHTLDGPDGVGSGFRITVAVPTLWPDQYILKVWSWDLPARRNLYTASLNNTAASSDAITLSANEAVAPWDADDLSPWLGYKTLTTEVTVSADGANQTLTYDITRIHTYYISLYAVALYRKADSEAEGKGFRITNAAGQRGRPAGASS